MDQFGFDRFSNNAKRILAVAQEMAAHLAMNHISTEHVLLSMLREKVGLGYDVLTGRS